MNTASAITERRGRFDGAKQIVRYNWPQYVAGLVVVLLAAGWSVFGQPNPEWLRWAALVIAGLVLWWSVASVAASFWIYDASPLYRWTWIPDALGMAPRRWLNLHAGLDESSAALRALFAEGEGETGDFFDPQEMSEDSIHRARSERERVSEPTRVNFRNLPYPDQFYDGIFLLFAAHELRRATSRKALFQEIHRVLAPSGRVLLVEHVRDLANFVAFGPGFFHFMTTREWRRVARSAGLRVIEERRMTPFVKIVRLEKEP